MRKIKFKLKKGYGTTSITFIVWRVLFCFFYKLLQFSLSSSLLLFLF